VGLHEKLPAGGFVRIYDKSWNVVPAQNIPGRKPGGPGPDDGDLCSMDAQRVVADRVPDRFVVARDLSDFANSVDIRDADSSNLAVDEHLAGTAFPDPTFEAATAIGETVAVNRITGLVQRRGDGETFLAGDDRAR